MVVFTVSHWADLKIRGSGDKPCCVMFQIVEGRSRGQDTTWAKVIEAGDWRSAYKVAEQAWKDGDPGEDLESLPIRKRAESAPQQAAA